MTDIRIAPATDARRFLRTDLLTWFQEPVEEPVEESLSLLAEGDRFAAEDRDDPEADPTRYAGTYGVFPLHLTVPGPLGALRQVPIAGLTWVSVHPDARRRGVLTAMMADHLERTRAAGGSGLSALHASEPSIYGRFGYGLASWSSTITLSRGSTLTAPGLNELAAATRTRVLDADDPEVVARVTALQRRLAAGSLGSVALPERVLGRYFHDLPPDLRDTEPGRVLIARRDGDDVGYAVFHRKADWSGGTPGGVVSVWALDGDPASQLALVRRFLEMDLTAKTVLRNRITDDLLVAWSDSPRVMTDGARDSLWVRLADLPVALAVRGYAAACRVVLDVTDAAVPDNAGRWLLEVGDDGVGQVTRTGEPADVALDVSQLGAAYLGDRSLLRPLAAGRLTELREGAVRELDAALRSPVPAVAALSF